MAVVIKKKQRKTKEKKTKENKQKYSFVIFSITVNSPKRTTHIHFLIILCSFPQTGAETCAENGAKKKKKSTVPFPPSLFSSFDRITVPAPIVQNSNSETTSPSVVVHRSSGIVVQTTYFNNLSLAYLLKKCDLINLSDISEQKHLLLILSQTRFHQFRGNEKVDHTVDYIMNFFQQVDRPTWKGTITNRVIRVNGRNSSRIHRLRNEPESKCRLQVRRSRNPTAVSRHPHRKRKRTPGTSPFHRTTFWNQRKHRSLLLVSFLFFFSNRLISPSCSS